ncbi:hypothetical protein W97_06884 [Coniosporium apollinis CBS 100218]|uniref:Uncharacterized protein n=1 Tax=Coniosporium apollinis (strain CBS 100218) TaxID=1168221 RepID=R7Z0R6_CONA1|nr:uncharacterized protein W97_06884 [Coniosporium apollinis CBS 100218]EON67516.1 hypothetical protein W97_06884 [Coniosporium apollinis CBS 100218]
MNLPADKDSRARIVLRKLKWMAIGILAPEAIVCVAVSEWCDAKFVCKELWPSKTGRELAHGFLIGMGGIIISTTDQERIRLQVDDFVQAVKRGIIDLPVLESKEIEDKSKADWVSKSVACVQIGWLLTQVIGRTAQHISVTPLEMFALGIVVCAITTYGFWWQKPFDVQTPVVINTELDFSTLESRLAAEIEDLDIERFPVHVSLLYSMGTGKGKTQDVFFAVVTATASILFGLCHVAAWSFAFPTFWERLLWQVSAIACVTLPVTIVGLAWVWREQDWSDSTDELIHKLVSIPLFGLYTIVRVLLLFEVFFSLRSVPPDVYQTVNWAAYIPHI